MIDYQLTGIDENGELIIEVPLTAEKAGVIILDAITSKSIEIVSTQTVVESNAEVVAVAAKPKNQKKGKNKPAGKRTTTCKNCGELGHISKTCTNAPKAAEAQQSSEAREPLSAEQYGAVRTAMHDREFQSGKYSLSSKLSPKEVNAAIRSRNYEDYLDTSGE
jgi:hypothetical protein